MKRLGTCPQFMMWCNDHNKLPLQCMSHELPLGVNMWGNLGWGRGGGGAGGTAGAASQCGCEVAKPREAQKDFLYILLYMEYVCPGSVLVTICAIYVTELAT